MSTIICHQCGKEVNVWWHVFEEDHCVACYQKITKASVSGMPLKPIEPIFTIVLYEAEGNEWKSTLTNCVGKQLAVVTAPELSRVWDMLWAALRREVHEEEL